MGCVCVFTVVQVLGGGGGQCCLVALVMTAWRLETRRKAAGGDGWVGGTGLVGGCRLSRISGSRVEGVGVGMHCVVVYCKCVCVCVAGLEEAPVRCRWRPRRPCTRDDSL